MDIYEVELCHRGRWEQQHARFVAASDADEAAYRVTGKHLRSEGERRKVRVRIRRLGIGSEPPKLFYAG
jgi:putative NADPH-quinone reductase